jgi:hypothetical protein
MPTIWGRIGRSSVLVLTSCVPSSVLVPLVFNPGRNAAFGVLQTCDNPGGNDAFAPILGVQNFISLLFVEGTGLILQVSHGCFSAYFTFHKQI